MIYHLDIDKDKEAFKAKVNFLYEKESIVELCEKRNTRTTRQNSALHLFFCWLSDALNEIGIYYNMNKLTDYDIEVRYTYKIVKEYIWRPIQLIKYNIYSTTEINTIQINEIVEEINLDMGLRGIYLDFPSIEKMMFERLEEKDMY